MRSAVAIWACAALVFACADAGNFGSTAADADTDSDGDTDADADTESGSVSDTATEEDSDTDTPSETDSESDCESETDTPSDSTSETASDVSSETDDDTESSGPLDAGADTDTQTESDTATGTESPEDTECLPTPETYLQCGADKNVHWYDSCGGEGSVAEECGAYDCLNVSDSYAECGLSPCTSNAECDLGLVCNEAWGKCVVSSCTGQNDFTPCEVVTADPTDRGYDICIGGTCVSPGCGTRTCNAPSPAYPLPDTNARACYSASAGISCTAWPCGSDGSPQFCGQDAQYGWDTSHDAASRFRRIAVVATYPVVVDSVTGLMWMGCALGLSGDNCETGGTGTIANFATQVANCDALNWGGFSDWRLPSEHELQTIVNYGATSSPLVDPSAFPGTPADYFWSSSTRGVSSTYAWTIGFANGHSLFFAKTTIYRARCVRGVPIPRATARFTKDTTTASGQPTVADAATGLEWQGCVRGRTGNACGAGAGSALNWTTALDYCEELNWGGHTDWRLPNVVELRTIINNKATASPLIDTTAFPSTTGNPFWTSTSIASGLVAGANARVVNFGTAEVEAVAKTETTGRYVRCVR